MSRLVDDQSSLQPDVIMGIEKPLQIALFYDGFEMKARDGLVGKLYSDSRRALRYLYRSLRRRQVHTGFYTAFRGLAASLRAEGVRVRINDFSYARAHPDQPIGVAGYLSVLEHVDLPNPMIFGPGDYGSGEIAQSLARNPKIKFLTQPSDWAVKYNERWVGNKGAVYFAGIDTAAWPDLRNDVKSIDFLIYDKIHWHRSELEEAVLARCISELNSRGMSFCILRYGSHHIDDFRKALSKSKSMLFLCQHETQGLAYQEAMSSGVPILAWDEGKLVDPISLASAPPGLSVSSVPYFDERCGLTFQLPNFPETLDKFLSMQSEFDPRRYVTENISLNCSGKAYLRLFKKAGLKEIGSKT